ncbi:MAG: hypothetical protein ABEK36_01245 [Candidatus Aenigmatarchaeota archaeon]
MAYKKYNPYEDFEGEALPEPRLIKKKILEKKEEAQQKLIELRNRPNSAKRQRKFHNALLNYYMEVKDQIDDSDNIDREEKDKINKLKEEILKPQARVVENNGSSWGEYFFEINKMLRQLGVLKLKRNSNNISFGYEIFDGIKWPPTRKYKNWHRTLINIKNLAREIDKKDKDARGIVWGKRGLGKSTFSLWCMKEIYKMKTDEELGEKEDLKKHFVGSLPDIKRIRNESISPYLMDEMLTLLNAKRAMSNENVETEEILSKMRYRNTFGFWCTTQPQNLSESHIRQFDFLIEIFEEGKFKFYNGEKMDEFEKKSGEWRKPTCNWIGHFPRLKDKLWNRYTKDIEPEKDKTRKEKRKDKKEKKKEKFKHKCSQCGHEWEGRKENPAMCPKCQSRKWDK